MTTRRDFLRRSGLGFGGLALASLLGDERTAAAKAPDRSGPGRARSVIMLMQSGGPSQMDLFDPKPELQQLHGQSIPLSVDKFLGGNTDQVLASPFRFRRWGQSGMELAELLPHIGSIADDICLVRSMHTGHDNHPEGLVMLNSGKPVTGRPTLGAWVSYALGTENRNLPAFVVLRDPAGYDTAGTHNWSAGWLPALHRGTEFSSRGVPVPNLRPPAGVPAGAQNEDLDFLAKLNEEHRRRFPQESELEARIHNYELAARMQLAAGDVLDIAREPASVRTGYGLDDPQTANYGTRCLLARRLVEAGVRFVQVYPDQGGQVWDTHGKLKPDLERMCAMTDQPSATLIRDLKARGLLDSTIVLWAGEFGRLPVSQNKDGRDHNRHAFSLFLAGGGFRGGLAYGKTDDFGYRAVEDRVSVPSLHATLLHQLGLDHHRLTYPHEGRDESLTDAPATGARVVKELLV